MACGSVSAWRCSAFSPSISFFCRRAADVPGDGRLPIILPLGTNGGGFFGPNSTLAAASGSGLDPHISEHAARYQAPRVAGARGLPPSQVETLINEHAFAPGGVLTAGRIVNVLELNLALDRVANANAER